MGTIGSMANVALRTFPGRQLGKTTSFRGRSTAHNAEALDILGIWFLASRWRLARITGSWLPHQGVANLAQRIALLTAKL